MPPISKEVLFDKARFAKLLEHAWLDLGDTTAIDVMNPFLERNRYDIENPHIYLLKMMRDPDNFYFTCRNLFNVELLPMQAVILKELWYHAFPMLIGSRGFGKTFLLSLYAMLRALFHQGRKIVICGSGFRQAKLLFEFMEVIWHNAPVLRNLIGYTGAKNDIQGLRKDTDRYTMRLGDSTIIGIPIGDGQRIRGLRANDIINDEFAALNPEIYETVIAGFAAVSSSPVEGVKYRAKRRLLEESGLLDTNTTIDHVGLGNQSILSGTAYYDFNHFADYWRKYKNIIESKGEEDALKDVFGGVIPPGISWKDFVIIRIPYELVPDGFMDEKTVARSKATLRVGTWSMEYGAVFSKDSRGFFKRSVIEGCVAKENNPIQLPSGPVSFHATTVGDPSYKYVYGIDPASEHDNFAIVVLELHSDHTRIVYCWTTTRKKYGTRFKSGEVKENNFYAYCARKIRELMKVFPCETIAIDSQGGGYTVVECLHDSDKLKEGELLIWPVIDENKPKDTDDQPGLHIVHLISFSDSSWVVEANHGLKADMAGKLLLFPHFDPLSIEFAMQEDHKYGKEYDTLEDCVMEIEEIKDELATIIHTASPTGRDQWQTPSTKEAGGKIGRLRKDRYSALLMANMLARNMHHAISQPKYQIPGGVSGKLVDVPKGKMFIGPAWLEQYNDDVDSWGAVSKVY